MQDPSAAQRWLAAVWPVVRGRLPAAPARVVELGCGPLGGFVPMLRSSNYQAVGVDPDAPEKEGFQRVEFEQAGPFEDVDVVVAAASLHHVADPADVIERVAGALTRGGTLVEWDWQRFDEPTADWCFRRLASNAEGGWLHRRRDEWLVSGRPWGAYLTDWARREGLHDAELLLRLLDERFDREHLALGPYFFPDLADTTQEHELAAIEAGEIRATRVDYAGRLRQQLFAGATQD